MTTCVCALTAGRGGIVTEMSMTASTTSVPMEPLAS